MPRCRWCKDEGFTTFNFKRKPCVDCPPPEFETDPYNLNGLKLETVVRGNFKYGWFSQEAKNNFGSILYRSYDDPSREIEVTSVAGAEHGYSETDCPRYGWSDKVFVGRVTDCLYKKLY